MASSWQSIMSINELPWSKRFTQEDMEVTIWEIPHQENLSQTRSERWAIRSFNQHGTLFDLNATKEQDNF